MDVPLLPFRLVRLQSRDDRSLLHFCNTRARLSGSKLGLLLFFRVALNLPHLPFFGTARAKFILFAVFVVIRSVRRARRGPRGAHAGGRVLSGGRVTGARELHVDVGNRVAS